MNDNKMPIGVESVNRSKIDKRTLDFGVRAEEGVSGSNVDWSKVSKRARDSRLRSVEGVDESTVSPAASKLEVRDCTQQPRSLGVRWIKRRFCQREEVQGDYNTVLELGVHYGSS